MIGDSIKTLLGADDAIAALVGGRIYPVILPRGYTYPAICFHVFSDVPDYDFAGTTGHKSAQVQIDCYGASATSARQVAAAVTDLLADFSGSLEDGSLVEGAFIERDMDMPFLPTGDAKGISFRVLLQVRFEYHN